MEIIKEIAGIIGVGVLSLAVLFALAKIMGNKQISQLSMFDYITGITIGSIAAELATELEEPLKPLLAMIIYGIITYLISYVSQKSPKMRKFFSGAPIIVMRGGKFYRENLKKARIDMNDFTMMCREAGFFDLGMIGTAIIEHNGRASFLPKSDDRPATPADMGISVPKESLMFEVVLDGRIMDRTLRRSGIDRAKVEKELRAQKVKLGDVGVGLCDENGNLAFYLYDK